MVLLVTPHMVLLVTTCMGLVATIPIIPRLREGAVPRRLLLLALAQHAQLDSPNRCLSAV
jgi:hypothetical protein